MKGITMKRMTFVLGILLLFPGYGFCIDRQTQADFYNIGTPADVTVSTSVWTAIPAVSTGYRLGILFGEYATNSSNMLISITTTTTNSTSIATGLTFIKGSSPWLLSIDSSLHLWAVSLNGSSGSEKMYFQELK